MAGLEGAPGLIKNQEGEYGLADLSLAVAYELKKTGGGIRVVEPTCLGNVKVMEIKDLYEKYSTDPTSYKGALLKMCVARADAFKATVDEARKKEEEEAAAAAKAAEEAAEKAEAEAAAKAAAADATEEEGNDLPEIEEITEENEQKESEEEKEAEEEEEEEDKEEKEKKKEEPEEETPSEQADTSPPDLCLIRSRNNFLGLFDGRTGAAIPACFFANLCENGSSPKDLVMIAEKIQIDNKPAILRMRPLAAAELGSFLAIKDYNGRATFLEEHPTEVPENDIIINNLERKNQPSRLRSEVSVYNAYMGLGRAAMMLDVEHQQRVSAAAAAEAGEPAPVIVSEGSASALSEHNSLLFSSARHRVRQFVQQNFDEVSKRVGAADILPGKFLTMAAVVTAGNRAPVSVSSDSSVLSFSVDIRLLFSDGNIRAPFDENAYLIEWSAAEKNKREGILAKWAIMSPPVDDAPDAATVPAPQPETQAATVPEAAGAAETSAEEEEEEEE